MRKRPFTFALALAALALAGRGRGAAADPAERGLDLFVHAPPNAVAGDVFVVDLRAYGFGTVTTARPLANAAITAAWDPESLGPVSASPPDVAGQADATGTARLRVPVPLGDARKLALLVAVRSGEHVRTRTIHVQRTPRWAVALQVADRFVVPGSTIPAWVTVTDTRSGAFVPDTSVDVELYEGAVVRARARVVTDRTGLARTSLAVPAGLTGALPLSLRAVIATSLLGAPIASTADLGLREESPATPRLGAQWKENELRAGETGHVEVRLRDAADEPLGRHALRWWVGPKGTTPPASDEDWKKGGRAALTDGLGVAELEAVAPRVLGAHGTELTVLVRAEVEGQALVAERRIPVGTRVASAEVVLEGGALVPGLPQRAFVHVGDGAAGVAGEFEVVADGLRAKVTTDAHGDGELTWNVPADVGAARAKGPCAGGVAAGVTVRPVSAIAALARHPEPFELCVPVDRERSAVLRTAVQVARVGDKVRTAALTARAPAPGAGSVTVTAADGIGDAVWTGTGTDAEIDLAHAKPGLHVVSLAQPRDGREAQVSATRLLVVPRVLPRVQAKLAGGAIAPGGFVEVDVALDDGHGKPITGSAAAVVIDREGGGTLDGLDPLDTRRRLCDLAAAPRDRCDAFLEGDAELLRRRALGGMTALPVTPDHDPAAGATKELRETFGRVLHSLEGAVYEAQTPESLRDVRRKEGGRWIFNPELLGLATAAMSEPPRTPGGEPFRLADLVAVDRQVTFDAVARRVTRLKLFNVLAAVRAFRTSENLGDDEPLLRDPNALLRRLVRSETLPASALLDPWGGTLAFVRANGPGVPFLDVARGFVLHSPGPDGVLGNADDVKDPFERVVASGTPYASAMGEDEIVDARLDMRVADATVQSWQTMFARLTGTELGGGSGTGEGVGYGSGHGSLGGSHRAKAPTVRYGRAIALESSRWTDPVRTDAQGRVRLRVPLGDEETTWRIAVVARGDAGEGAVTHVDVPVFLPVSARVDLGKRLTIGDEVSARVMVRNRITSPRHVVIDLEAAGGLALPGPRRRELDVPPTSARSVFVPLVARAEGMGRLTANLHGGVYARAHEVEIGPAGEPRTLGAAWTMARGEERTLRVDVPPGYVTRGRARLVVESGHDALLADALGSLRPDGRMPPDALADAVDAVSHVLRLTQGRPERRSLAERASETAALANAYLGLHAKAPSGELAGRRAALFTPPSKDAPSKEVPSCPGRELANLPPARLLESEPPPAEGGPLVCYTEIAARLDAHTPLELARAVFALVDRPHRAAAAASAARELARVTKAERGVPAVEGPRGERAIVIAALVRTAHLWKPDAQLVPLMLSLRDGNGGYGSAEATRDVIRALAALPAAKAAPARVLADGRALDVAANGAASLELGAGATSVELEAKAGPVLVRLVRPMLRPFAGPPDTTVAPVTVTAAWPDRVKAGATGVIELSYAASGGRSLDLLTTVPLPPGVELAAVTKDVSIRQGVLHVRKRIAGQGTVALPVRFTLPGRLLVPESVTVAVDESGERALTAARSLVVVP